MNEIQVEPHESKPARLQKLRSIWKFLYPFVGGIITALLAVLLYSKLFPPPPPLTLQQVNDTVQSVMASATPPPSFSSQVYQIIQPSLVLIQVKGTDATGKSLDGLGTGFIVDDKGDILTSLHVVDAANDIQVTFSDGTQSRALLINRQPVNDTAVIQAYQLPSTVVPAVLGNPNSVRIGDDAYAVGNPLGLYDSMTSGVISGLNRTFQPPDGGQKLTGLIQIDAAVNPGNSGGPLLNRYGQVIGIITGLANPTGQDSFAGIGFAVPIDAAAGGAFGSPVD